MSITITALYIHLNQLIKTEADMTKQLFTLMGIFVLLVAAMATSVSVNATECMALNSAEAYRTCHILDKTDAGR